MATFTIKIHELFNDEFDFGLTKDDYPIQNELLRGIQNDVGQWQYQKVDEETGGQTFYGLNRKIIDHYFYNEIGQESPDMFRFMLNERMRVIMPYYNQLLYSATLKYDPFSTLDTTHSNTTTGTQDALASSRTVTGNTPQVALAGNADYASAFTDANSKSNATSDNTSSTHMTGSQGHTAALLMQWRRSFLNIEAAILADLSDLFFEILDTPESAYGRNVPYYARNGYGAAFWPYF